MKIKKYHPQHAVLTAEQHNLAGFWRRTAAMIIDITIVMLLLWCAAKITPYLGLHLDQLSFNNFHVEVEAAGMSEVYLNLIKFVFTSIPILYFALVVYFTNGKTIGKWVTRIRVVSIYHHHISFWHCIERALGYAASTLEAGLGFLQIFWNPNRMCLHDRIAETIVISEKKRLEKKK